MIEQLFIFTLFIGLCMSVMHAIGANVYDLKEAKKQRQFKLHPYARRFHYRPKVSIVVTTRNSERTIDTCLTSLIHSSYQKYEIIIIDQLSQDATKALVKQFIQANPKKSIRLISQRSHINSTSSIASSAMRCSNGELILFCSARNYVDKRAISIAVRHFNVDPKIGILEFNNRIQSRYSTIGLFQKYDNLLQNKSKKFTSITNSDYGICGEVLVYRRNIIHVPYRSKKKTRPQRDFVDIPVVKFGNKKVRSFYASDAIAYTEPATSFLAFYKERYRLQLLRAQALIHQRQLFFSRNQEYTKFLTWFRMPFAIAIGTTALFLPILLSYFVYIAITLHEPTLLIISWVVFGLLLLFAIWGDEQLKLRHKASFSTFIPITYGLLYVLSFVQLFVILRTIMPFQKLRLLR